MAGIRARGRLTVGVNSSKLLFSRVNPANGQFEGFDVDLVEQVAIALFGAGPDGGPREGTIRFVAVPTIDRTTVLTETNDQGVPLVDMVADTFTINCVRAEDIDFSAVYLSSGQDLLVPDDFPADTGIDELTEEHRVCAANGSTSLANLENREGHRYQVVGVPDQAECLVLLQQGQVDAVSTDTTILAGMLAQDPNLRLLEDEFTTEPYGWGLPPGEEEWVRYVNAVLEEAVSSGTWADLYDRHLAEFLGPAEPPAPGYAD
jgi:polar amino acid transport system substrate-binding protein